MHKVLYVCGSSGIGGAETFLKQTTQFCDRSRFENHYLLFRCGPLFDFLKEKKQKVYLIDSPPRLSKISDHKNVQKWLKKIINEQNIDLVHSTMAYSAIFCGRRVHQMGKKHVWFQHGPASGWMDRLAAALPHDALITNSHFTSQRQRELENPIRFIIPRKMPIEKILLGTDGSKPSPERVSQFKSETFGKYNLPADTVIISMLCRIQHWKGVHILLEALKILKQQGHKNIHCLIWGEAFKDDSYLNQLQNQITKDQLPANLAGSTNEVPLALSISNCIVNASIQPEPFGLSIIEGMILGAVPIVPNEGGPIEVVSHGKNGLVFDPRDPDSLAQNLQSIIKDEELRSMLSEQTQKDASTRFHASRMIEHLENFHAKVLS